VLQLAANMAKDTMIATTTRPLTLMLARVMLRRGGAAVKERRADAAPVSCRQ
jgi:hypothetical protein